MRRVTGFFVFVLFGLVFSGAALGFIFEFKEVDVGFVSNALKEVYKDVYVGGLEVSSRYIEDFLKENWGISNFSSYLTLSNSSLYLHVVSEKTNFFLRRLPIPLIEGIEAFFLLPRREYLSNFRKFGVADYGDTRILGLWYNDKAMVVVYISRGSVVRMDYWIKEGEKSIMVWSYLCAYSERKTGMGKLLSGILLNLEAREFYKFDFKPF